MRLARRLQVGLDHTDQDLAARIAGATDEIFLAIDDPFVALERRAGFRNCSRPTGNARFGHHIGGADFAVEGGFSQRSFCSGVPTISSTSILPVSGAEQLSDSDASGDFAEFGRNIGIVEVGERGSRIAVGQEEIPQPCRLRLGLRAFKQLSCPGAQLSSRRALRPSGKTPR